MNNNYDRWSPLLEAKGLFKTYGTGAAEIQVLKGIDITISSGEMVAVIGASGSGKTTLLQVLGTLDRATRGTLSFSGRSLENLYEDQLSLHRNQNIGFIFQFHHLLPEFSALENVMMPGLIHGENKTKLAGRAEELLSKVNLSHRLQHRSGELSGGEQQRVALARALIMNPSLLLADEPTGNLDSKSGQMVFDLLHNLSRERKLSVVMVTHNQKLAQAMDRCLTLQDGVLNSF